MGNRPMTGKHMVYGARGAYRLETIQAKGPGFRSFYKIRT
jgi:hypothetical protein